MKNQLKVARVARLLDGAIRSAVWRLAGLLRQPGEAGYNPDATKDPEDWSDRTRSAIILARGAEAKGSAEAATALAAVAQRWPSVPGMKFDNRRRTPARAPRGQGVPTRVLRG